MNRAEWMGNQFKNENHEAYDWVPEVFPTIDPAPRYHNKALGDERGRAGMQLRRAREGFGTIRSGVLQKRGAEERAKTGRLWAHLKHIEMKNHIRDIRT